MRRLGVLGLGVGALMGFLGTASPAPAHGGVSVGIGIGIPVYRPWCGCGYYYRPYYPVYVPPPVYIAPAPVVLQPAPVVQPAYQIPAPAPAPAVTTASAQYPAADNRQAETERNLQLLADPDERVRLGSVLQLGRSRADRAVDPLAATLAGDRTPAVREAAARSLGLLGSPKALPALYQAAQSDSDHDVRQSAKFAIDVIQNRQ
jgi:hypothetical protein